MTLQPYRLSDCTFFGDVCCRTDKSGAYYYMTEGRLARDAGAIGVAPQAVASETQDTQAMPWADLLCPFRARTKWGKLCATHAGGNHRSLVREFSKAQGFPPRTLTGEEGEDFHSSGITLVSFRARGYKPDGSTGVVFTCALAESGRSGVRVRARSRGRAVAIRDDAVPQGVASETEALLWASL
jgi:hypothetical protein